MTSMRTVEGHRKWKIDHGQSPSGDIVTVLKCECGWEQSVSSMAAALAFKANERDPVLVAQDAHLEAMSEGAK